MEEEKKQTAEELDSLAAEQSSQDLQPEQTEPVLTVSDHYVERPRFHRVLAWILFGIVALGVILYYLWLSGVLK